MGISQSHLMCEPILHLRFHPIRNLANTLFPQLQWIWRTFFLLFKSQIPAKLLLSQGKWLGRQYRTLIMKQYRPFYCLPTAIIGIMLWLSRVQGFGLVRRQVSTIATGNRFYKSPKIQLSTSTAAAKPGITIRSIDFIEDAVLEAMNELFDPAEVARGNAIAKLNKPKK